jgi:la-related protein 1
MLRLAIQGMEIKQQKVGHAMATMVCPSIFNFSRGSLKSLVPGRVSGKPARIAEPQKAPAAAAAPLPPPADAMSWPTPDNAQDEEKKKAQDRADKAEKEKVNPSVPKPHGKEKWTAIPFVPSAVFNTPIPQMRRGGGGRPSRGGRDGGTGRGGNADLLSNDNDRPGSHSGFGNQPAATFNDRGRADLSSSKTQSTGAKSKRSASAGPPTVREQRKGGESPSTAKRKEQISNGLKSSTNQSPFANDVREAPTATHINQEISGHSPSEVLANDAGPLNTQYALVNAESGDRRQSVPIDTYPYPRSNGPDRRSEGPRPYDYSRELFGSNAMRERGDGRPERGRGGYRGRGNGSHGFSNQPYMNGNGYGNGHASGYQAPMMPSTKSQSNHERHPSQQHGSSAVHPHPRSLRSNSRSQSIPHSAPYGRYSNGQYPAASHLASIQTDIANAYGYQPGNQGTMSAFPYSPYVDQVNLYGMVSMQM